MPGSRAAMRGVRGGLLSARRRVGCGARVPVCGFGAVTHVTGRVGAFMIRPAPVALGVRVGLSGCSARCRCVFVFPVRVSVRVPVRVRPCQAAKREARALAFCAASSRALVRDASASGMRSAMAGTVWARVSSGTMKSTSLTPNMPVSTFSR